MDLTLLHFLIICPLTFLAGFVDSIAGGGGLISLPAFLMAGVPPHLALGTNKLSAVLGTATSVWRFSKHGFIQWKKVFWFVAAALAGSTLGANLALQVSEQIVEYLMLVILPVVAFYVLRNKKMGEEIKAANLPEKRSFWIALTAALVIGLYDGFYGPGTGTFLLLILTGAANYTMKEAAGTTKAINLASNAAAVITFLLNGKVLYSLGLAAALANIAGNYLGSGMVMSNGQKIVRPLILIVLSILFVKILFF